MCEKYFVQMKTITVEVKFLLRKRFYFQSSQLEKRFENSI